MYVVISTSTIIHTNIMNCKMEFAILRKKNTNYFNKHKSLDSVHTYFTPIKKP